MKTITRSTRETKVAELIDWAKEYELNDLYPQKDPQRRFGIGLYQIFQAMDWEDSETSWTKYEGYASCAIHMFLCAGLLDAPIEQTLKKNLENIDYDPEMNYEQLVYFISRAQQMIIYGRYKNKTDYQRRSRFDLQRLAHDLACIIILVMSAIPSDKRADSIEAATTIMTEKL